MVNDSYLNVTFIQNKPTLNLRNIQVTDKNLKPLWSNFSEVNNSTFQFKTDESYEVEVDYFTEDNGNAKSNLFNRQCQWNFIPQNKAVSYKGENICLLNSDS